MSLLSLALSLVFLALSFLAPNTLTAFLGLGALGVAAFARLEPRVRTLNLALLTLAFTLFLRNSGNTLGLIGLVGILVALTTLPRIPRGIRVVLGLAILLLSVPIAGFANTFIFELGIQIGIFAAMSLGLNVVVGMAGLLDLGYAAFFAVGAYTWAIFGSPQAGKFLQGNFPLPGEYMYLFMLIAVVTTAITGLLIGLPALRLRGDYLAIVTLGLGEVVRILANNLDHWLANLGAFNDMVANRRQAYAERLPKVRAQAGAADIGGLAKRRDELAAMGVAIKDGKDADGKPVTTWEIA